jgi:hypothetical protein
MECTDDVQEVNVELGKPWHERAACRGSDPRPWVATRVEKEARRLGLLQICERCSVREECLVAGLYEDDGIWGGMTPRARVAERQRRIQAGWKPPKKQAW